MTTDTATYLYAVTTQPTSGRPAELSGIGGAPVRVIEEGRLAAVVGTVPLAEFGEAALRRNLEDLAWLEATARAHNGVVEALAQVLPTAPVRLVTVYRDDEQVRELLHQQAADFESVLARVEGCSEWGVKVFAAVQEPAPGPAAAEAEGERPGTAYLRRRQAGLRQREDFRRRVLAQAEEVYIELSALAKASRRHPPQDPQLSGRREWMVLNAAFLVDDGRTADFRAGLATLDQSGLDIELTGPWAPYSFAVLESAEEVHGA